MRQTSGISTSERSSDGNGEPHKVMVAPFSSRVWLHSSMYSTVCGNNCLRCGADKFHFLLLTFIKWELTEVLKIKLKYYKV